MNLSMNNQIEFNAAPELVESEKWGQWFRTQSELFVSNPENKQHAVELLQALERRGPSSESLKSEAFQLIRRTLHKSNVQLAISQLCQMYRRVQRMYNVTGLEMPSWVSNEYSECDSFLESLK